MQIILDKLGNIQNQLDHLTQKVVNKNSDDIKALKVDEQSRIKNALRYTYGNKRKAAKILGISTKTLYRKMKKYEIPLDYS